VSYAAAVSGVSGDRARADSLSDLRFVNLDQRERSNSVNSDRNVNYPINNIGFNAGNNGIIGNNVSSPGVIQPDSLGGAGNGAVFSMNNVPAGTGVSTGQNGSVSSVQTGVGVNGNQMTGGQGKAGSGVSINGVNGVNTGAGVQNIGTNNNGAGVSGKKKRRNKKKKGNGQGSNVGASLNQNLIAPTHIPPPGYSVPPPPPQSVERDKKNLEAQAKERAEKKITVTQRARELREAARGEKGDRVQLALMDILNQNLNLAKRLQRYQEQKFSSESE